MKGFATQLELDECRGADTSLWSGLGLEPVIACIVSKRSTFGSPPLRRRNIGWFDFMNGANYNISGFQGRRNQTRTRNRRVPAGLRVNTLAIGPAKPPKSAMKIRKICRVQASRVAKSL
ncbi:hypothetical protein PoB_005179600 [Plakobranchus ocellatus]|uniref:Uncharacterized protein n=1 Tax=Plakobranchus ocellatus TaxID=259542 RepID=A0AAV4C1P0_9GAST|nr:hypothetical protein PoB_005179600 [Plakobranchus ocellatus]